MCVTKVCVTKVCRTKVCARTSASLSRDVCTCLGGEKNLLSKCCGFQLSTITIFRKQVKRSIELPLSDAHDKMKKHNFSLCGGLLFLSRHTDCGRFLCNVLCTICACKFVTLLLDSLIFLSSWFTSRNELSLIWRAKAFRSLQVMPPVCLLVNYGSA